MVDSNKSVPAFGTPEWDAEIVKKRKAKGAVFLPRVIQTLASISFAGVHVELFDDSSLDAFMDRVIWDVSCAVVLQDTLLLVRHKNKYVLFDRHNGSWDRNGIPIVGHRYAGMPTGAMHPSLDEALWVATKYLSRCGLAKKSRVNRSA